MVFVTTVSSVYSDNANVQSSLSTPMIHPCIDATFVVDGVSFPTLANSIGADAVSGSMPHLTTIDKRGDTNTHDCGDQSYTISLSSSSQVDATFITPVYVSSSNSLSL